MASSRTGHRRGATPATLSPHPKPALSLEEWEARAPLGDLEIKSVNALKLAGEKVPLPNLRTKVGSDSRPTTPINRPITTAHPHIHPLHPKQPVHTPQFYECLALINRSVAHSQELHFRVTCCERCGASGDV